LVEQVRGTVANTVTGDPSGLTITPVRAAVAIAVAGAATILGAWFFQYVIDLKPCPLCLEQRVPYYLAIAVAAAVAWVAAKGAPPALVKIGFALLAVILLASAGMGVYHAGIEWKFWPGPTECTGELGALNGGDLLSQIRTTSVVRCDEAAWRFLGLSLAGYNVLISLGLAAVAAVGFAVVRKG
jgi:disulfide bond formation protein DsbB